MRYELLVLVSSVALLGGCKWVNELRGETPQASQSCVDDLQTVRALEIDLEGDLPARVRATLTGAVHLNELSKKLDREVADVCVGISRDLGDGKAQVNEDAEPGERAKVACEATAKRIRQKREEGGAVLLLYPHPPICTMNLDEYARCARECDPAPFGGDGSKLSCDPESAFGRCEAKCQGTCFEMSSENCKGTCRGECRGGCEEDFFGKCGGRCSGTCDGASVTGKKCEGTCDGKCSADAEGSCQGKCNGRCSGSCLAEASKSVCGGTCAGTCSEEMKSPRCGAVLAPAEMLPVCSAMCDAELSRQLSCTAGHADVVAFHSAKEGAADQLKAVLAKRLELLLAADDGMRPSIDRAHEGIAASFISLEEALNQLERADKSLGECLKGAAQQRREAAEALERVREASLAVLVAVKG